MAMKKYSNNELKNKRWIKEGRGAGRNSAYKPWITVRDLSSEGRSHRIFGHKSQRTHHLLSDLELAVFLLLEWDSEVTEIREQFPLEIEITRAIAIDAGISHLAVSGIQQYMSSDFLVNTTDSKRPKFVIQAKYSEALTDYRTIEKLELERRYWNEKEVPWFIVTEIDIPKVVVKNIAWLYPAQRDEVESDVLIERTQFYAHHFNEKPNSLIVDICKALDVAYVLPTGESLFEVRQLLANRCFYFDFFIQSHKLKACDLTLENIDCLIRALYVSNQ